MLPPPAPSARKLASPFAAVIALAITGCATPPSAEAPASPFHAQNPQPLGAEDSTSDLLRVTDAINPRDGARYRTYRVELEAGAILRIHARSSDFSPGLSLLASDGTLLGASDAAQPTGGRSQLIRRIPAAGTYYLVISSQENGQTGSYDLHTELIDTEQALAFPGRLEGFLVASERTHPRTHAAMNTYPLTLDAPTVVEIHLRSSDFDPYLSIVEAETARVLGENDDWGESKDARIVAALPAGRYEIWASAYHAQSASGQYTLQAGEGRIERSDAFVLGERYQGFLGYERAAIPGSPRAGDRLDIAIDEPAVLSASMKTADFDAYLVLTDADGHTILEDDDSGGGRDARVVHPLDPGRYAIWASSYHGHEGGSYQLETSLLDDSRETEISLGGSVEAVLTLADGAHASRGTAVRYYNLSIDDTEVVQIDVRSSQFDAYLVLEDDRGRIIAENDDARAGATDAQLTHRLSPGVYRIGVTSYAPQGGGSFTLAVRGSSQ